METSVGSMIMYEDESVDVRYSNGARLQLSPCGCEFMLLKPADASRHPLQTTERVRQRTRFTISAYKEMMVAALAFRNKYASRPYLPEELIPTEHKKPFVSLDSDVQWPEWSSCDTELGPDGETIIRSEGGRAVLMLSPSAEDFSVTFTCSLSCTQSQLRSIQNMSRDNSPDSQQQVRNPLCEVGKDGTREVHQGRGSRRSETSRSRSCSPRITSSAQAKPEEMYQSTTVLQHHSCCSVAPIWHYPLSLARHLWTARLRKAEDVSSEGAGGLTQALMRVTMSDMSIETRSRLPQALPLTCPSPHWHRWKFKDPLAKDSDQDFPTELVKVMWSQGVTYRILSGTVAVIEVSPGDGSIIRSNGVLSTYFTHHKPDLVSGQVKQLTYHLSNLPPDVPGQLYSICSIVSRASRILTWYNEAKLSLKLPATPSCLQEGNDFSKPAMIEESVSAPVFAEQTQTAESRLDLVAAELEKIKRFKFLLQNTHLLRSETGCVPVESTSAEEVTREAVSEKCITEALQRTSRAIQDIDAVISAATLT